MSPITGAATAVSAAAGKFKDRSVAAGLLAALAAAGGAAAAGCGTETGRRSGTGVAPATRAASAQQHRGAPKLEAAHRNPGATTPTARTGAEAATPPTQSAETVKMELDQLQHISPSALLTRGEIAWALNLPEGQTPGVEQGKNFSMEAVPEAVNYSDGRHPVPDVTDSGESDISIYINSNHAPVKGG
jgi:hypothetical protein